MTYDEQKMVWGLARALLSVTKATAELAAKTKTDDEATIGAINNALKELDAVADLINKEWWPEEIKG